MSSDKPMESAPVNAIIDETRRFNHDLNIDLDSQRVVKQLWPKLIDVLIDEDLIEAFHPHETKAKVLKLRVQRVGSAAVILMVGSLLGSAAHLWAGGGGPDERALRFAVEISALAGLLCAVLASRYGPWRRRWLRNRFMTEVLRQWHFRQLLVGTTIDKANESEDERSHFLQERKASLTALLHNLRASLGQKMDHLVESGTDVLGPIPSPHLPKDPESRSQLLAAYRLLRLDHQLDFAVWKLSIDDKTFMGISSLALDRIADQLSGTTLIAALICSAARLVVPLEWVPFAAVSFAILGVGVRAWRDGLCLGDERERYHEMQQRLEFIITRWDASASNERRFQLAEEVEQLALEELRSFTRSHEKAQFLF